MSRLGPLGGTTGRAGAEARSSDKAGEAVASAESRRRAASALIETHDAVFRRTARRYSICADDSEDAYQRALEILLTKAPPIEGDNLVRWMQTVTKREALAVRRQRERLLGSPRLSGPDDDDDRDPLDSIASASPEPDDRLARRERVVRSGEALNALKPQEVRALTLKAQGYSYAEIGEITGWSYTKINRCMAEGRKRFLQVFADIEDGRRCEELASALSEMADGENANGSTEALEFHLRSCATCRAKLRAFRAIPDKIFELMPSGPLLDQSNGRPSARVDRRARRTDRRQGARGRLLGALPRGRWRWGCRHGGSGRRITRGWNGRRREGPGDLRCDRGRWCDLRGHRSCGFRHDYRRSRWRPGGAGEAGAADGDHGPGGRADTIGERRPAFVD